MPGVAPVVAQLPPAPPLTAAQFGKLSQRVDSIEGANLPAATVGAKLVYEDTPPLHSSSGRPVRLTYAVVTEGLNAKSDWSNMVSIVPLDVAVPPDKLVASPNAKGVTLTWAAPTASVTGNGKPVIAGYNIYRVPKGESLDQFPVPVNAALVKKTEYTDVPPYGTFDYRVTAVASEGPPRIESDPSAPATATFKDLVPPPPPASVTALVETKVVRLVWDAVDVPDLAGYNIYRTESAGQGEVHVGPADQADVLRRRVAAARHRVLLLGHSGRQERQRERGDEVADGDGAEDAVNGYLGGGPVTGNVVSVFHLLRGILFFFFSFFFFFFSARRQSFHTFSHRS